MDTNSNFKFARVASTFFLACISGGYVDAHLNLGNRGPFPGWRGIAPNERQAAVANGGFVPGRGPMKRVVGPWAWQGPVWAPTGCNFDSRGTGECGGTVECNGQPPVILAQLSIQTEGKPSFYDASFVDGFNVGVSVSSRGSLGRCSSAGCVAYVNGYFPRELQVLSSGQVVACNSASYAFDPDQFCCRNEFNTPNIYSRICMEARPAAYSYASDTPSPLFICITSDFTITFCPSNVDSSTRLSWYDDSLYSLPQPV